MGLMWDVIILAVLGVSIWLGYRKGLIRTLFGMLGIVIAFLGAMALKGPVGGFFDDSFVHTPVEKAVVTALAGSPIGDVEQTLADIDVAGQIRKMPAELKSLLESVGLDADEIASSVQSSASQSKKDMVARIADPISATISTAIAFLVLFILLCIACQIAARFLSAMCNLLPVGKQLNGVGGAVAGLIRGALLVLVVCTLVGVLSVATEDTASNPVSRQTIEKTLVFKEIVALTPAADFMK